MGWANILLACITLVWVFCVEVRLKSVEENQKDQAEILSNVSRGKHNKGS